MASHYFQFVYNTISDFHLIEPENYDNLFAKRGDTLSSLLNWLSVPNIADICGIVGLLFSVAIWKTTGKLKTQITTYRRTQSTILTNLMAQRDSILLDEIYTISIRSQIRTELYGMLQNFSAILTFKDRFIIHRTIRMINKKGTSIKREELCSNLDYIIARFRKKEDKK